MLLWFLTAINGAYPRTFSIPVVARPSLEDVALSEDSIRFLKLELYGRGLELIQQYQRLKNIELTAFPGHYADSGLVRSQDLITTVNALVMPQLKLVRLYPDTFHFRFRKLYGQNVAIQPNFRLTYAPGYGQTAPIKFLPDSLRVFSFKPFKKLPEPIKLEPQRFENLKSNTRFVSHILLPLDSSVFVRKHQVMVELDVHRITEGKLMLPIRLLPNIPGIRLVPSTVEVSFEAGLHHFKEINAADFQVVCYWQQRTSTGHLPVVVRCSETEVLRYRVFPKQIDYILP